jgi:hypothetical protein
MPTEFWLETVKWVLIKGGTKWISFFWLVQVRVTISPNNDDEFRALWGGGGRFFSVAKCLTFTRRTLLYGMFDKKKSGTRQRTNYT